MFEEVRDGSWLRARVAAVETGLKESTMKQLCDKLELDRVMAKYVKESDEEESRTVEMYDMVSLVSTRSNRLSMQIAAGEQLKKGIQPEEGKQMAEEKEEQEAQQKGQGESNSESSHIKVIPKRREQVEKAAEKAITAVPRRTISMDAIREEQEQQPVMAAVKMYVQNKVLPKDKLMRIRVLEQACLPLRASRASNEFN